MLKKRTRAQNFDELEKAFFGLVLSYNDLVDKHNKLKRSHITLVGQMKSIEYDNRSYGLDDREYL